MSPAGFQSSRFRQAGRLTSYPSSTPFNSGGLDPHWANVSLLLPMDGADGSVVFTDAKGAKGVSVFGNAQIDTAIRYSGSGAGMFDGSGDYLSVAAHSDFEFGANPYTFDGHIRNGNTGDRCLYDGRGPTNAVTGIAIYATLSASGGNSIGVFSNTAKICGAAPADLPLNTWVHWAVVRSGNNIYVFIGGVLKASGADARTYGTGGGGFIAANGAGGQGFQGHLDNFRITKGVARWTADFTPPPGPFPTA